MKTITTEKSNFGRFGYTLTTTIGDEVNDATTALVVKEALPNLGFRAIGSEVEKALVKAGVMTKDSKRSEVSYSLETSKLIATAAQAKLDAIAKKEGYPEISYSPTGEHVYGEAGEKPTKEATELWTKVQGLQGDAFEAALKKLGLGEDYDDDSGILACKAMLTKAREAAKVAQAAALGL